MAKKVKKAQVVIAALNKGSHSFDFLLLQTNQKRGSFWQNITGKIEEGETIEEGALREAIEETALQIESIIDMVSLGLSYHFTDQHQRDVHEECFLIILDDKWDIKIDPHEHQDFKWVDFSKISQDDVKYSSNFEALNKAKNLLRHWGTR